MDSLLDSLREIVSNGDSDAIRLRAIETALKMHGSLSEKPAMVPSITITINSVDVHNTNPILIPREIINVHSSNQP